MRKALTYLLVLVIVGSLTGIGFIYYMQYTARRSIKELRPEIVVGEENAITTDSASVDFSQLKEMNADFTGWLFIRETNIDLPVMKNSENPLLYLDRNFAGEEDSNGLPFLDERNSRDFTDEVTIIYGHNMKSGMIFHDLEKFEDPTYFNEHQAIAIYTEEGIKEYSVIAYIEEKIAKSDSFDYNFYTTFATNEEKEGYINSLLEHSVHKVADLKVGGPLLILSTCDNITTDGRIAIIAVEKV